MQGLFGVEDLHSAGNFNHVTKSFIGLKRWQSSVAVPHHFPVNDGAQVTLVFEHQERKSPVQGQILDAVEYDSCNDTNDVLAVTFELENLCWTMT